MAERFQFLVVYVGSAATAAFLAASLCSSRIATYDCAWSDAWGVEQCELVDTRAALSVDGAGTAEAANATATAGDNAPAPPRTAEVAGSPTTVR